MKNGIFAWGLLAALALPARADIVDGGNLQIGGQGVFGGSVTVQGSAFSVGGATFSVAGGSVTLGGRLNAATAGVRWADGTTSTTAARGGGVLQAVSTFTAGAFNCGQIPRDDSIPQSSEGTAVVEISIAPQIATSTLIVSAVLYQGLLGGGNSAIGALFKDGASDAVAVGGTAGNPSTSAVLTVVAEYVEASGSTTSRTFKLRCGGEAADSSRLNGEGGGRVYGGVLRSGFTIQEIGG